MLLTSQNVNQFLAANSESMDGVTFLETLGFRRKGNQIAFGFKTKKPVFGATILRMLGVGLNKGINAKLPKMEFKFVECETVDEPLDFSEFEYLGEAEADYTVYKAYKLDGLDGVVALKADNGCFALISA